MAQFVNEPVDYELTVPVEMIFKKAAAEDRVERVETVRIRPMVVGDMKVMDAYRDKKIAGAIVLAARLTGQSEAVIEKLSMVDFNAINEIIGRFLPKDPETGETSSAS
jgi:hypothetical protein